MIRRNVKVDQRHVRSSVFLAQLCQDEDRITPDRIGTARRRVSFWKRQPAPKMEKICMSGTSDSKHQRAAHCNTETRHRPVCTYGLDNGLRFVLFENIKLLNYVLFVSFFSPPFLNTLNTKFLDSVVWAQQDSQQATFFLSICHCHLHFKWLCRGAEKGTLLVFFTTYHHPRAAVVHAAPCAVE